jgi:uncharacterized membrane protein YgcG
MDAIAEIRRLYFATTRATIQRDIEKAIDLLKTLTTEDDRERATVFMDGLSQMRSEWGVRPGGSVGSGGSSGSGGSGGTGTTGTRKKAAHARNAPPVKRR